MKENRLYFQQQQIEKLKELGSCLRQFREEQSVSLEEVAAQTRIQSRLLRAIEEGRLEELPEPVYIRGFIRKFADALGLNGSEFAHDFPTGPGFKLLKPTWRYLPASQLRPIHLYLMYILLVICSVSGLSYVINRSPVQVSEGESYRQPNNQLITKSSFARVNSAEKLGPITPAANISQVSPTGKPVRVGVTLKSPSWIRVVADGKTEFEGVLPQGSQRTWVADEKLVVRAGNAGGVLIVFNDEKAKKLGDPGKVQEVIFAANPRS